MGNTQKIHIQTVRHPKLGEVVPKERYGKHFIVYSHIIPPSVSLESWEQEYHKLSDIRKDCLFLPETYNIIGRQKNDPNGSRKKNMQLVYQNYMYLLDQQIQNRRSQKKYYTEPDLWFMLYHMLGGAAEMDIRDIRVGDIRPKNIVLDQNGRIKMITRMSWPGQLSGFEKVLNSKQEKCYLAPEEVRALSNIRESIDLRSNKTQAFSIGVTVLQLALLQSSETLYDYNQKLFNNRLLENRVQKCSQRYSQFFLNTLKMLTDTNPKERASCGECWATLSPYGESIDNVLPFAPNRQLCQRALDNYVKRLKSGRFS